ncbi:MAG: tetratricopeptide repeat protein [Chloroflexi bacterium]|nr:tetratricopeptide repeat protein [Chloroflexota bacterium]
MAENNLPDLYELWDYGDPAATAVKFHNILPQSKAAGDVGYMIELLTQIARTESLQGSFAEAHTLLDEAEGMLTPNLPIPQIRIWLERGRSYHSAGEKETAVTLFKQAYELGRQSGEIADFYTIDAAHMLGITMPTNDEQLDWNLLALGLTGETAVPRAQKWRGSLLNNIGWTYHDRGNYQQALTIFEQAHVWHEENAQDKPEHIRTAKWCVGHTYRSLERNEEALTLQEALATEYERLNEPPDGFVSEEIGECLLALERTDEARPYFAQAYELLSQMGWIAEDRLIRLKKLGEVI